MPFKQVLRNMLEKIPDARGAILVDWEGEAVDQVSLIDDFQLKLMAAHKGIILERLRQAVTRAAGGLLEEISILTDKGMMLILPVTEDYFLLVVSASNDGLGKVSYEARRCAGLLYEEIA